MQTPPHGLGWRRGGGGRGTAGDATSTSDVLPLTSPHAAAAAPWADSSSSSTTTKKRKRNSLTSTMIAARQSRTVMTGTIICFFALWLTLAYKFGLATIPQQEPQLASNAPLSTQDQQQQRGMEGEEEDRVFAKTNSRFFHALMCPDEPSYPATVPMVDLLGNWNPDDTAVPPHHHHTLCRFDFQRDYDKALRYQDAEVPFVVYNVPDLDATAQKWQTPGYLEQRLANQSFRVEISASNHFLYYNHALLPADAVPPTRVEKWTYGEWLDRIKEVDSSNASASSTHHYYFRVSQGEHPMIEEDLSVFDTTRPSFFLKEPEKTKGIHCRFGAPAVLADAHYDGHNNMIALIAGTRRWILAPPAECRHAYLRPAGDPSARHSQVNWSAPDLEAYPLFAKMQGLEVILTPGEVLYVPSFWIHFIQNLDVNAQCNVRGSSAKVGVEEIQACGFGARHML